MGFTKHKKRCLRESFTGQNHSQFKRFTEKSMKITNKIREFDCLTGHSVSFLLFETTFIFMLFETYFVFVICSYVIWYIIQVYTAFNSSRTKENITTKRRRSFAFAFECRRSSQRTNN